MPQNPLDYFEEDPLELVLSRNKKAEKVLTLISYIVLPIVTLVISLCYWLLTEKGQKEEPLFYFYIYIAIFAVVGTILIVVFGLIKKIHHLVSTYDGFFLQNIKLFGLFFAQIISLMMLIIFLLNDFLLGTA